MSDKIQEAWDKMVNPLDEAWQDITPEQNEQIQKDKDQFVKHVDKQIKDYLKKNSLPDRVGYVIGQWINHKSKYFR